MIHQNDLLKVLVVIQDPKNRDFLKPKSVGVGCGDQPPFPPANGQINLHQRCSHQVVVVSTYYILNPKTEFQTLNLNVH